MLLFVYYGQAPSTIQLVEAEKAKQRAMADSEKRAERERQVFFKIYTYYSLPLFHLLCMK